MTTRIDNTRYSMVSLSGSGCPAAFMHHGPAMVEQPARITDRRPRAALEAVINHIRHGKFIMPAGATSH